jgi:hypothetical protein
VELAPTQPRQCFESGCPLAGVAKGFVLGTGIPSKAKYGACFEAAGREEIVFELKPNASRQVYATAEECEKELVERRQAYPDLEEQFIRRGVPVIGPTGGALTWWIWPKAGIRRDEVFIDNVLRCLPPKAKNGAPYPTGEVRKEAERCCRMWDRWDQFRPDTALVTLHPSGLLREITPLPLAIKDAEKARDFASQGRRVLMLFGGKAAHAFLRYAETVQRWRGHYQALAADWSSTYRSLFAFAKKTRKKGLTKGEKKVENDDADFFAIPTRVTERARKKRERPSDVLPGICKSAKRHTHRNPPKCGFGGCWDEFERRQNALQPESVQTRQVGARVGHDSVSVGG